jgi:hypothetical protein
MLEARKMFSALGCVWASVFATVLAVVLFVCLFVAFYRYYHPS